MTKPAIIRNLFNVKKECFVLSGITDLQELKTEYPYETFNFCLVSTVRGFAWYRFESGYFISLLQVQEELRRRCPLGEFGTGNFFWAPKNNTFDYHIGVVFRRSFNFREFRRWCKEGKKLFICRKY